MQWLILRLTWQNILRAFSLLDMRLQIMLLYNFSRTYEKHGYIEFACGVDISGNQRGLPYCENHRL